MADILTGFASRVTATCSPSFTLKNNNPPLRPNITAHTQPKGLFYAFSPFSVLLKFLCLLQYCKTSIPSYILLNKIIILNIFILFYYSYNSITVAVMVTDLICVYILFYILVWI